MHISLFNLLILNVFSIALENENPIPENLNSSNFSSMVVLER